MTITDTPPNLAHGSNPALLPFRLPRPCVRTALPPVSMESTAKEDSLVPRRPPLSGGPSCPPCLSLLAPEPCGTRCGHGRHIARGFSFCREW